MLKCVFKEQLCKLAQDHDSFRMSTELGLGLQLADLSKGRRQETCSALLDPARLPRTLTGALDASFPGLPSPPNASKVIEGSCPLHL